MLMLTMIVVLDIIPIIIGYAIVKLVQSKEIEVEEVQGSKVDVGDRIVYRKTKFSALPGARAYNITASNKGENYTYLVDKYWVVANVLDDGRLVARTRKGKLNYVWPDDPNLRKAGVIESLFHRDLFPPLEQAA
jgi:hypothetical protein